jgi:hypothetical protein
MNRITAEMSDLNGSPSILDYEFDSTDFDLPMWLRIPPEVRDALLGLEQKAMVTIVSMKKLMLRRNDRFNSLCSPDNNLFYQHAQSMEHLLRWKKEWNHIDPTLAVSAKIPRQALNIFVDEHAYATLAYQYTLMLTAYLEGPFYDWCQSRDKVLHLAHRLMCNPRSLKYNNPNEFEEFGKWYTEEFANDMFEWESCLAGLSLPSYEETVLDLQGMIYERVDSRTGLQGSFFVGPL